MSPNEQVNLILSGGPSSDEISSGTEGSYFDEEDKNLIENKALKNKKKILINTNSFINRFEFIKNSNLFYNCYCENDSNILLTNICSIILFLVSFTAKLIFKIIYKKLYPYNYSIIAISIIVIPFLICTLIKMITIYKNLESKEHENENRDLIRLIKQKWNIYYSMSLLLLTINFLMKFIIIDILQYYIKIILIINIIIILISSVIFGIIYYLTHSSNNILITNLMDNISFPLSVSVLFSYMIIIFVEQIKTLIYNTPIYCFLLSCLSLILMVYYNDILGALLIFLYQLGGIKTISFYNMNFHTFCTLINFGFIIFMTFKNIRKHFFSNIEDNIYILVKEENTETNADDLSNRLE